jgi:putative endonuclease
MISYGGFVYILTNKHHTVFYVGVAVSMSSRLSEHQGKVNRKSFTARYNVDKLVYYEFYERIEDAIAREKQIKKYSRAKKVALIRSKNPDLNDLSNEIKYL